MYSQDYSRTYYPTAPFLKVTIFNPDFPDKAVEVEAFVDTGADVTSLPLSIIEALDAEYDRPGNWRGVTGPAQRVGRYHVNLRIGPYIVTGIQAAAVKKGLAEPIIGRDVLNQLTVHLIGPAEVIEVYP